MIGIGRPTVEPEVGAIAAELDLPLRRRVARLAQALELAGHEGIPIAPVRDDVIHHLCGCDDAAVETELAQRMALQLQLPQPLPKPVLDLRTPSRAAMGRPARLCGCGAPGEPCPVCNRIDDVPDLPEGFGVDLDEKGWRH